MTLDSKKRAQILQSIKKLVLAHHINVGGIDYGAWTERVDERTPELLTAELAAFEAGIRQLLAELKTSHTVFYHSLPKELLATAYDQCELAGCATEWCAQMDVSGCV